MPEIERPPFLETPPRPAVVPIGSAPGGAFLAEQAGMLPGAHGQPPPPWAYEPTLARSGIAPGTKPGHDTASDETGLGLVFDDVSISTPQDWPQRAPTLTMTEKRARQAVDPNRLLAEMLENIKHIAYALDPDSTGQLVLGTQSDARRCWSDGPTVYLLSTQIGGEAQIIAPPNAKRRGLTVFHENAAGVSLFLAFGSHANAQRYTVNISGGGLYELPGPPFYAGEISVWASTAIGRVLVTESY